MRRTKAVIAIAALAIATSGCGSKGTVSLTATAGDASLTIAQASPLVVQATGGFDLRLELGPDSPNGTDVSLGSFSIVKPSDQSMLLGLKLEASPAFPVHLEPGGALSVHLTIAEQAGGSGQIIEAAERTALCGAKSVALSGSVSDSAQGRPTPVTTQSFEVTGCP